jgi:hypothetical protein
MAQKSHRAAGLRTTGDLRADIGMRLDTLSNHLLRFPRQLLHELGRPGDRFSFVAFGYSVTQAL